MQLVIRPVVLLPLIRNSRLIDRVQSIEFQYPIVLLLLALALLPLLPGQRNGIQLPWIDWLPVDNVGRRLNIIWKALATLTIALLVIGLARPVSPADVIERVGRGAELSILLDRSASMDSHIRRKIKKDYQSKQSTKTKNDIAREALSWLLNQRPENRYALTVFHVVAMRVTDFIDDIPLVQAGLDASAIGRGAKETNMGSALLTAIQGFEQRPYTGSRALLLVSDGGAKLDKSTRDKIRQGLQRNQVSLYFIYVKSGINNADLINTDLHTVGTNTDSLSEEVALHLFFKSIGVAYQVFEADDEQSMRDAVAIIDQQQNLPLTYFQKTPGTDYSRLLFVCALLSCVALAIVALVRMEKLH